LVDGRARAECLLTAALVCSENGVVVLDDSERVRYTAALALFDVVEERLRFKVLRVKAKFRLHFLGFVNALPDTFSPRNVAPAVAPSPKMGMGYVPLLSEWSTQEADDVVVLAERCNPQRGRLFAWASPLAIEPLAEVLKMNGSVVVCDRHSWGIEESNGSMQVVKASLTGSLKDKSRDPNLNYSSSILRYGLPHDLVIVAGHRRNECLLSTAVSVSEESIIIVHYGDHPNLTSGRYLFDVIDRQGSWLALRRKKELGVLFDGQRSGVQDAVRGASITGA
jgi:hypothetical protein